MHRDKQDVGGVRKLFQDLVAPELGAVKATLALMREEAKAAEARSEQNFSLVRDEMKAAEARSEQNFSLLREEIRQVRVENQNTRADLMDRIERSRREVLLAIENQSLRQENEQLRSAAKRDQPSA